MSYYKVVYRRLDGVRQSAFASGCGVVEYFPGWWSRAPLWLADRGYHLLVWDSIMRAYDSMPRLGCYELWTCDVAGLVTDRPEAVADASLVPGRWSARLHCDWPEGTAMFRFVRLRALVGTGESIDDRLLDAMLRPEEEAEKPVVPVVEVPKKVRRLVSLVRGVRR